MAQITVDDKAFLVSLDEYVNETLGAAADEGINKACQIILNAAIKNCPVESGQLQSSLTMDIDEKNHVGYVGTNVEYAPYVEIGTGIYSSKGNGRQEPWTYQDAQGNYHTTSGNKPHPFLQPAVEQNREKITEVIRDAIANAKQN